MERVVVRRGAGVAGAVRVRCAHADAEQARVCGVHGAAGSGHDDGAQLHDDTRRARKLPEPAEADRGQHPVLERPG
eukprot:1377355-Rhodomonas_salina.1